MKNLILLSLTWTVLADCPKDSVQYENVCADTQSAQTAPSAPTPTSNEKPSRHPEAAWERGEVKADMPHSLAGQDANLDKQKLEAEAQGKKAAGIPQ